MKKLLILLMTLVLTFSFAGCLGSNSSTGNDKSSSEKQSSVASVSDEISENVIRDLMTENLNCMKNIFILLSLPTYGSPLRENIYQVDPTKFKNYAEFESYIKSVYIKKTADMLLNDYPQEGDPKYINADGKLCVDIDKDGGKGYYVDWSEYTVTITKSDAAVCEFELTATIEEPADIPEKAPYKVNGTANFEDGKWLLTKMIY